LTEVTALLCLVWVQSIISVVNLNVRAIAY